MSKPNKKNREGIVFSTDPEFNYEYRQEEATDTIPPFQQKLRVTLDRKQRGGKAVTLITGFVGKEEDLQALGKLIKNRCGVGGSAKEGEILIQGDHRAKVILILKDQGYSQTKQSGG